MNLATTRPWIKNIIHSLPEIWYILLLLAWLVPGMRIGNTVITVLSLGVLFLLTKQLFRKSGWVSMLLGFFLTLGSFILFMAMLSEYNQFPVKNTSGAFELLLGGGLLIGTSFIFSVQMLIGGIRKTSNCL